MADPSKYKVCVFVPSKEVHPFIGNLRKANLNRIGNYASCFSWHPVMSTWIPLEGSHPYMGKIGHSSVEEEYKVEMLIDKSDIERVLEVIKEAHPYEVPEIDIFECFSPSDLLQER